MIILGLYNIHNCLYFKNENNNYITYRGTSKAIIFPDDIIEEITDIDIIQNTIKTHNDEINIKVKEYYDLYKKTGSIIYKNGYEIFKSSIIENTDFPLVKEE